jgi:group I intron endonuclease
MEMVIYKVTNLMNNKIYIGQDSKNNLNYLGSGKIIKRAIIKYGKDNFTKEILEYCDNKQILDLRERYWIAKYNSKNKNIGYNITNGGEGCLGLKHTEETKKHLKLINSGDKNPMFGKTLSNEILLKRSLKVKKEGTFKGKNNGNFKYEIKKEELLDMFITNNLTILEIATHYNCSKDVINDNLRNFKINKPKSNKYGIDLIELAKMLDDGLSQIKIAEFYGCGNKYINKIIKTKLNKNGK